MSDATEKNVFDFLISDQNEVLLIIYSVDGRPDDPAIVLFPETNTVEFFRDDENQLTLEHVKDDVFQALSDKTSLMICEIEPTDNPDEVEIIYNYNAEILKNNNE